MSRFSNGPTDRFVSRTAATRECAWWILGRGLGAAGVLSARGRAAALIAADLTLAGWNLARASHRRQVANQSGGGPLGSVAAHC